MTAHRFVCIDLLINHFMANWQLAGDLLRAPLQTKECFSSAPDFWRNPSGITTVFRPLLRSILGLAVSISSTAGATCQLSTNGRLMASQNPGNLNLGLSCFHKRLNLIRFGLAEVCVGHILLRLAGQKALILMCLSHPTG
jgi:hypothetical protein